MKKTLIYLSLLTGLQVSQAHARQPYHSAVVVDNLSVTVSAPNLVDLNRELRNSSLETLLPSYHPNSAVSLLINLRGLIIASSFAENSTTLVINIPKAGVTQTFTAETRDESLALLKDFIKEGSSLSQILKAYARNSPIDPIAGNPDSLMARMANAGYRMGHVFPLEGCYSSDERVLHQFEAATDYRRSFVGGFETTSLCLPLRYCYSPNSRFALILDAPQTYNRNGGASSFFSSLGLGLRSAINKFWVLTPSIRAGAGGSLDLCTAGSFFNVGLTSTLDYTLYDCVFSLTNYVGYITSTNLWLTGVNFNYHLQNSIYENGLSITSCEGFSFCRRNFDFKLSLIDSIFSGHRLYITHSDRCEVALITKDLNPCSNEDSLSLGLGYQWAKKNYRGYYVNLHYFF